MRRSEHTGGRWNRTAGGLWAPSRRDLFRGVGGLAGAAALGGLSSGRARAQSLEPPKRVIFFHHSQGTVMNQFVPTGGERDFVLPHVSAPLEPWRDRMVMLTGVDNMMPTFNEVGNAHENALYTIFTGRPYPVQDASRLTAAGPTIDQVITERIAGDTPFGRLDFVVGGSSSDGFVTEGRFWVDRDDPVVSFNDPTISSLRIFGDGSLSEADAWALRARRSSVLDAVLDGFRSAERRAGAAGKARLQAHQEKLFALEQRIRAGVGECNAPRFVASESYDHTYDDDVSAQALNDVLVTALSCDYARVATVDFANTHDHAFPWLWADNGGPIVDTGVWDNWHAMVHADFQPGMEHVYRWYMQCLADLLERLSVTVDADGDNMLDTTLVVYMSEFSSGRHWATSLPVVLAGNVGLVETGRWVDHMVMDAEAFQVEGGYAYSGVTTNQLYVSLLQILGFDDESFGHDGGGSLPSGGVPGLFG